MRALLYIAAACFGIALHLSWEEFNAYLWNHEEAAVELRCGKKPAAITEFRRI